MKQIPPSSPLSGSPVARLRRYAVPALCAAVLTLAAASSLAQRRTALRAPRGAAAEAPRREAERESPRERAEERRRAAARTRARAAKIKARQQDGIVSGGRRSASRSACPRRARPASL